MTYIQETGQKVVENYILCSEFGSVLSYFITVGQLTLGEIHILKKSIRGG